MKKFIFALTTLFTMTVSAQAMSYEQARQQALFLTDKMAYELNLTDAQYEAAYEINLDYLMGITTYDDLYGTYWRQRNLDLSYILLDWQYRAFVDATYFYRPIYWQAGYWHFAIYARYPHRDYYFFGCPHFYTVYRGGHSWRVNGGHSWYHGRSIAPSHGPGRKHEGMRDHFERGNYGQGTKGLGTTRSFGNAQPGNSSRPSNNPGSRPSNGQGNKGFGNSLNSSSRPVENNAKTGSTERTNGSNVGFGNRQSSTRATATKTPSENSVRNRFIGSDDKASGQRITPNNTFTPSRSLGTPEKSVSTPSRSVSTPNRSVTTPSRSVNAPSRSVSSSSRSSSVGSSRSSVSRSSGSSASSRSTSSGSKSFGGRR